MLRAHGARSAPQLAVGFPAATCVSVNDEAAHGIPSPTRVLRAGDLVNVDVSAELDGYWADTGASAPVGRESSTPSPAAWWPPPARPRATPWPRPGPAGPLRHIGRAVERSARRRGFSVIANLCGHGVGGFLHEAAERAERRGPRRPHRAVGGPGPGGRAVPVDRRHDDGGADGWTLRTADGSLAAQFEHTIVVTQGAPGPHGQPPAQSSRL